MSARRIIFVLCFFTIVGMLLGLFYLGPYLGRTDIASSVEEVKGNPIERENSRPGSRTWEIVGTRAATTQIQAFVGATSVSPGSDLSFYVSTQRAQTLYTLDIYRLGWYKGMGARLMKSILNNVGSAQGYYDVHNRRLVDCNSCLIDRETGLIETRWQPSYSMNIPRDWTSGVYLAKFTDINGWQTYAPFTVLGNENANYVAVTSETTHAAYNSWGGASLYTLDEYLRGESLPTGKAVKVSFNKPYLEAHGASHIFLYILQVVRWMERGGYNVSYMTDIDLHAHPERLLKHKAYISLGHDEYWTKEMRDGVEYARDQGIGLAFMGANVAYWQMRFEPDSTNIPYRTVVSYKVDTLRGDLERDPMYGKDNSVVTSKWRDPVVGRPENALLGIMFSSLTHDVMGFSWRVDPQATTPLLQNTQLELGKEYGCGLVGYEWDRIFNAPTDDPVYQAATPKGIQIIASSNVIIGETGASDISHSTYYVAPSGAFVFATGSIYWGLSLDDYRAISVPDYQALLVKTCESSSKSIPEMQALMHNIMQELLKKHAPVVS